MLEELGLGKAAAVEVPGAFEDACKECFFESADGDEVDAECLFEVGEGGFEAEGDDESTGCEGVAGGVEGGCGFALVGAGSGGVLGVRVVGEGLGGCGHLGRICVLLPDSPMAFVNGLLRKRQSLDKTHLRLQVTGKVVPRGKSAYLPLDRFQPT